MPRPAWVSVDLNNNFLVTTMPLARILLAAVLVLIAAFPPWAGDAAALIAAGEAKLKAGQIDAALTDLRQAVAVDAASSLAQTRLGGALLLHQDYGQAIDAFRVAISLSANNADAFIGMAIAYLHGGDYALARASLEEAGRIDPAKRVKIAELIAAIDQRETGGAH